MIKITIKGETYSFDNDRYPLSEAIELEAGLGMTFSEWQRALFTGGSAKAAAGLAWLVLRRNGQQVPLEDILTGKYELDTGDISAEPEGDTDADPTVPPGDSGMPSGNGSGPSPSTTATPPPTSAPSALTNSIT